MKLMPGEPVLIRMITMLLAIVLLATAQASVAQAQSCGAKRDVSTRALDEMTWRQLNSLYEKVSQEEYDEALQDLKKMLGRAGREIPVVADDPLVAEALAVALSACGIPARAAVSLPWRASSATGRGGAALVVWRGNPGT